MPVIDHGKRIGTKRRTITGDKLFTQDKGTPQILYNIDCMRDPELAGFPLMIVEGEIDCAAAIQSGYPKTVSVPGGAADGPLDAHTPLLETRLLTSLQRPELLLFIEHLSGRPLDVARIRPGAFVSVAAIERHFFGDDAS